MNSQNFLEKLEKIFPPGDLTSLNLLFSFYKTGGYSRLKSPAIWTLQVRDAHELLTFSRASGKGEYEISSLFFSCRFAPLGVSMENVKIKYRHYCFLTSFELIYLCFQLTLFFFTLQMCFCESNTKCSSRTH